MAKRPEAVTEKEIDEKAIPALYKWVKESGILGVLDRHGIRNYLFLLVGGCGFGYAARGSDTDLVLLYNSYEKRYTLEEYERMHGALHDYYFAPVGHTEKEGERIRRTLEKKEASIRSSLCREKELVGFVPLAIELCEALRMSRITDEYGNLALYYPNSNPLDPKLPKAALEANKILEESGLHFGEVFLRPLHHYKDVIARRKAFETAASDKLGIWPDRVDEELAETLFLLKGGLNLGLERQPVKVVYDDKKVRAKFARFVVSLINIDHTCDFAERYGLIRYFKSYVKKWKRTNNKEMEPYAGLAEEALRLLAEFKGRRDRRNVREVPENEILFNGLKAKE